MSEVPASRLISSPRRVSRPPALARIRRGANLWNRPVSSATRSVLGIGGRVNRVRQRGDCGTPVRGSHPYSRSPSSRLDKLMKSACRSLQQAEFLSSAFSEEEATVSVAGGATGTGTPRATTSRSAFSPSWAESAICLSTGCASGGASRERFPRGCVGVQLRDARRRAASPSPPGPCSPAEFVRLLDHSVLDDRLSYRPGHLVELRGSRDAGHVSRVYRDRVGDVVENLEPLRGRFRFGQRDVVDDDLLQEQGAFPSSQPVAALTRREGLCVDADCDEYRGREPAHVSGVAAARNRAAIESAGSYLWRAARRGRVE